MTVSSCCTVRQKSMKCRNGVQSYISMPNWWSVPITAVVAKHKLLKLVWRAIWFLLHIYLHICLHYNKIVNRHTHNCSPTCKHYLHSQRFSLFITWLCIQTSLLCLISLFLGSLKIIVPDTLCRLLHQWLKAPLELNYSALQPVYLTADIQQHTITLDKHSKLCIILSKCNAH